MVPGISEGFGQDPNVAVPVETSTRKKISIKYNLRLQAKVGIKID